MADAINLNTSSPGNFNQPTQSVENPLTPAETNPSTAATTAPPTAAPNVSTPVSQPAGGGSAAVQSSGLGGGVSVPSQGLGGGVSNPSPVLGDGMGGPCCGSGSSSSTGSGLIPTYPTPADLPAITAANVGSQARVQDIGDGSAGLYVANVIGAPWSFIAVLA